MIHTEQKLWTKAKGWESVGTGRLNATPQLVLAFGARQLVGEDAVFQQVRNFYPGAYIILCSTAGEILDTEVRDDSISLTAVHFEKSIVRFAETNIAKAEDSLGVGKRLAEFLPVEGLVHGMVFSDGLDVNGTQLVRGINDNLPASVTVTGGLVGDGIDFKKTLIGRDAVATGHRVVLLGFYGESLRVGFGSFAGWDPSGKTHVITKSKDNILYELDHQPALAVYKNYLGDKVTALPGSALLFPLKLHSGEGNGKDIIRTILGVSEHDQTMTFAGDLPEGTTAELMTSNADNLIRGALTAAQTAQQGVDGSGPELAVLVSCVGRKLVLGERTHEEVKAVRETFGPGAALCGFYSYGELCPGSYEDKHCLLHNQTMTITAFREV